MQSQENLSRDRNQESEPASETQVSQGGYSEDGMAAFFLLN